MKKEKILKLASLLLIGIFTFLIGFTKLNASTASISVRSSNSTIVVGKTFTVTVNISSAVPLGTWEYTISYSSSVFKLMSGQSYIVDFNGNGTKKSASYTYTFKAIASGTGKIGVKSYAAYDWSEAKMSVTAGSVYVKSLTQAQLEATYSKNNYLKTLSVEVYKLTPTFNKDTLEYSLTLPSNTENIKVIATKEDSRATITGTGNIKVSEGYNKIQVEVTAQNGSIRTYTINAKVTDENPITVTTTEGKTMTIVKRESLLTIPETFTKTTTVINDIKVPSFYSEIINYTLVALKDEEGNISLYIYSKDKNTYTPYTLITFDQTKLSPLNNTEEDKFENYSLTKIKINNNEVSAYKIEDNSDFSIIYAVNIENGEKNYYFYDSKTNSVIRYNSLESDLLNKKINKYYKLIIALCIESIILIGVIVIIIVNNNKINKDNRLDKRKRRNNKEI